MSFQNLQNFLSVKTHLIPLLSNPFYNRTAQTFQFMPGLLKEGARDDEQAAQSTPLCNSS